MSARPRIVFVCLHGSAKSVIAEQYLRRFAQQEHLALDAVSAGTEPDASLPPHVVNGLTGDGFDMAGVQPRTAHPQVFRGATHVVSFGPDVGGMAPAQCQLSTWSDVPAVADGYETARSAIRDRVRALVTQIAAEARPA